MSCENCGNEEQGHCLVSGPCHDFSEWIFKTKTAPKNIDQENKPKPSLLPLDCLIDLLCPVYAEGLIKYYRESWRKGFYVSDMFDATIRHLTAFYYGGEDVDQDSPTKKLHLGGAIFSIICMYWSIKINSDFDDRPGKN